LNAEIWKMKVSDQPGQKKKKKLGRLHLTRKKVVMVVLHPRDGQKHRIGGS
jgi:hypothetical protein